MGRLRNPIVFAALCAVATTATAQESTASEQLDAAMSEHTNVAEILLAAEDCVDEINPTQTSGASGLEAEGWVRLSEQAVNLERAAPQSRALVYVRRNVSLTVSRQPGAATCRIIGFLDTNASRSGLTEGLRSDLGFAAVSRSSKFALRNSTLSDEMLAQFYETNTHLARVKFEPDSANLGVNIVIAPNL